MAITVRRTSTQHIGPKGSGKSAITRFGKNGTMSTSYKTRIKTGDNTWITQTCGNNRMTSTSSSKVGNMTTSVTNRGSVPKAYKPTKSTSTSRTTRSSGRKGNGPGIEGALLLGVIAGVWFLLMAVFKGFRAMFAMFTKKAGTTQSSSGLMSTQEVPAIEAKQ
jgi:hypothetical protein